MVCSSRGCTLGFLEYFLQTTELVLNIVYKVKYRYFLMNLTTASDLDISNAVKLYNINIEYLYKFNYL